MVWWETKASLQVMQSCILCSPLVTPLTCCTHLRSPHEWESSPDTCSQCSVLTKASTALTRRKTTCFSHQPRTQPPFPASGCFKSESEGRKNTPNTKYEINQTTLLKTHSVSRTFPFKGLHFLLSKLLDCQGVFLWIATLQPTTLFYSFLKVFTLRSSEFGCGLCLISPLWINRNAHCFGVLPRAFEFSLLETGKPDFTY